MNFKKSFILIMVLVIILANITFGQIKQLPKFDLKDIQGKNISSDTFKGKVLLINFWATWCGPCKQEIPDLVKLHNHYREKGLEVISIAVSSGSPKDIDKFAKSMRINYSILIGDPKVLRAFGNVSMLPTTFIVDRNGQIQQMFIGAEPYKVVEEKIQPFLD